MKTQIKTISILIICIIGFLSCKKNDEVVLDVLKVYDVTETVNGKTRSDLDIAATKYYYPENFDLSPLNDLDGSKTKATAQPLEGFTILPTNSGGASVRSLTISGSKPVFFPIVGYATWYFENDPCDTEKPASGQTVSDLMLSWLTPYFLDKNVIVSATLDGKPLVTDFRPYKTTSATFKMKVPKAIAGGYCPGNTKEATWLKLGYSLLVKIPKGNHLLEYKGDIIDPDGNKDLDFHTEVKWNLTVE